MSRSQKQEYGREDTAGSRHQLVVRFDSRYFAALDLQFLLQ